MTALSVLGGGLGFGFITSTALGRSRSRRADPAADGQLDRAARQELTLTRLRELEEGNAAFAPEAAVMERQRLEIEAAKALRDLEQTRHTPVKQERATPGDVLAHPWLWGIGSAAFAMAVILGLRSFSAPREEGRPMTGGDSARAPGMMAASAAPAEAEEPLDPAVAELKARVDKDPDNVNLRLDLGDAYLKTTAGAFEAFQESKRVLEKAPGNPRALTQQAAVRSLMGQHAMALQLAEQAVAKEPTLVNGWIVRGRSAVALGKKDVAIESFQKAIALDPARSSVLEQALQAARGQLAEPAPEEQNGPAAAAAPPVAGTSIQGTVDIDPATLAKLPAGGFIFVVARQDGGGPRPLAAKRLPAQGFPLSFSLSQADAVMGGTLPDHVNIEARWDADGNAFTRDASDPIARQQNVALGATGLNLVLQAP
jgi:cytochrome c-type biogenesis protein CcmH